MRKLKLLLMTLAMVMGGGNCVFAQIWTSGAVAEDDGEYYLYNVGANCYLNRGGTYTAHAIVDGQGVVVKLDKKGEGVFSFYTGVNSKYLGPGCYTDEDEANWTLEVASVDGYENVYKLKASDSKYLYWVGGGSGFWGNEVLSNAEITEGQENNFYWMLISKSTRQDFASASAESPLEITYLVSNPDFEYQIQDSPWQNDNEMKPWTGDNGKMTQGWTNTNFWRQNSSQTFANGIFFEKWSGDGLTTADKIYQNVTLQAGNYRLTCTGYARCTEFYLYAGDEETHITDAGTYTVDFSVSESGSVEIGAKIKADGTGDWVAFDNVRLYCKGLYVQLNKKTIEENNGDITSLIESTFDSDAGTWTGGGRVTTLARGWSSSSVLNPFYETTSNGTLSCTLSNMPAGTYKVVAAARAAAGCTITPQIAGTSGSALTGVGDTQSATSEINLNGVEMPYSTLGGFTTNEWGHNWQWITATGTLAADGDLVINFICNADGKTGSGSWMPIDDVHLYCTNLDGTNYTQTLSTISSNTSVTNTGNSSVVTCDIKMSNPNAIISSSAAINGATGSQINNNLVSGTIANMVLYDGYGFTAPDGSYAATTATLYRSLPKDTWCTLVLPFVPETTFTYKKQPSELSNAGVLTFSNATPANDAPMLVRNESAISEISGARASGSTSDLIVGSGVLMTGVYTSGTVPQSDGDHFYYVVGNDNQLHKVTGDKVTISPFRAYFDLNNAAGARSVLSMNFDDETTGISQIENENMKNEEPVYNLNGQRVENPKRGLYIVGGKKVIMK